MTEPNQGHAPSQVEALLKQVQKKLIETGGRNRLVNVNRKSNRGRTLNIINERSADIFRILKTEGKKMSFNAAGEDQAAAADDSPSLIEARVDGIDESRYTDSLLETPLGPDTLQKRLLLLEREARTSEQEQGANFLFLALGFLQWFEDKSSSLPRWAPLILLPVELVRGKHRSRFMLRYRGDDISTNLSLQKRLRDEHQIHLPEIPEDDDWEPAAYFARVAAAVSSQSRWQLDEDGMQLGFFSFAKQLMLRDLELENWAADNLQEHSLFARLLGDGFASSEPLIPDDVKLDTLLEPGEIIQVTDADASQTRVIEEVRKGGNLVVQGPPGTGKSQTITNIIAAAVHDGKTVLFMAEKMAALSVVYRKLQNAGLQDPCLELHSQKVRKTLWAKELKRTLQSTARPAAEVTDDPAELKRARDELNYICSMLHEPVAAADFTPFAVLSELIHFRQHDAPDERLCTGSFATISKDRHAAIVQDIEALHQIVQRFGMPVTQHPFFGVRNEQVQPFEYKRLQADLHSAGAHLEALAQQATGLHSLTVTAAACRLVQAAERMGQQFSYLAEHHGTPRLRDIIQTGCAWQAARNDAARQFTDAALSASVASLRGTLASGIGGVGAFFTRLGSRYRSALRMLQGLCRDPHLPTPQQRLQVLDNLLSVQQKRQALLDAIANISWLDLQTDFMPIQEVLDWLQPINEAGQGEAFWHWFTTTDASARQALSAQHETARAAVVGIVEKLQLDLDAITPGKTADDVTLADWQARYTGMSENIELYGDWVTLHRYRTRLRDEYGLGVLLEILDDGSLDPAAGADEFRYACAQDRWHYIGEKIPQFARLNYLDRHKIAQRYQMLQQRHGQSVRQMIRREYLQTVPRGGAGEMGILRSEASKSRRHQPIRTVIQKTAAVLQKIKPVFLMSPISIAKFLPPGEISFDLLVVDEASQVRPEDALGAVARVRQIVVVGDQKQLPPTSFFDRMIEDSESDESDDAPDIVAAGEMESILSLCEARGLPDRMLEWHYRSKDPSLIHISNQEFYHQRLILPASPLQIDEYYGLKFSRVPGVYARGRGHGRRANTNRIEAEHIVQALSRHATSRPEFSLGIVTFSATQANLIAELVEHARRDNEPLDQFLRTADQGEETFVKSIENVQGDERDVIMISVGYGPDEPDGGLRSMNFGPINNTGGERRLNVLFTRSRMRCEVFASFDPEDIDLRRTTQEGPRVLKRFLDFAKTGQAVAMQPTGLGFDSPFEEDVAEEVEKLGFYADPQVGTSGFRIDIGVRPKDRPGQYILAIECDGATYHSSAWARERDHLRQQVLEGMGWQFHRIWSTDWFQNRKAEIERMREALHRAREETRDGIAIEGAHSQAHADASAGETEAEEEAREKAEAEAADATDAPLPEVDYQLPDYRIAQLTELPIMDPYQIAAAHLQQAIAHIIRFEGPLHADEIMRRILDHCQRTALNSKMRAHLSTHVEATQKKHSDTLGRDGQFYFTTEQLNQPPIRTRVHATGNTRSPEMLPPMEIRAAAEKLQQENGQMEPDEKIKEVARALGFQRMSQKIDAVVRGALAL